mmetsp:Transcript_75794/g.190641  ORF Transcript_75794/g.190641 Transcript_75794/m.190641 type:complete len:603 (-) Transcript_75794:53-1861(-)
MPRRKSLCPIPGLREEPFAGFQVLNARGVLPLRDPVLEVLLGFVLLQPVVFYLIKALIHIRSREFGKGCVEHIGCEVRHSSLAETNLLLLISQLGLRWLHLCRLLLLRFCFLLRLLLLLGLLFLLLNVLLTLRGGLSLLLFNLQFFLCFLRLLFLHLQIFRLCLCQLLLLLFQLPLALVFLLFLLELCIALCLLFPQQSLLHLRFEGGSWLAKHHLRNFLEPWSSPLGKQGLSFLLHKVGLYLHNYVVAVLNGSNCLQGPTDATVVQRRHTEAHVNLVVGHPGFVTFLSNDAALLAPVQDGPVAKFCVLRILLQEHVQPIKSALVGQANWKKHLVLRGLRCWIHNNILRRRLLNGAAFEGQRRLQCWAEIVMHSDVLESEYWEEGFALQALRQWLWWANTPAIAEKADGVRIWTGFIKVKEYGDHCIHDVHLLFTSFRFLLVVDQRTFGIKANAFRVVTHEKRGAGCGEAYSQLLRGLRRLCLRRALLQWAHHLNDPHLEGVAARFDANTRACAGQEELKTALSKGHEHVPVLGLHHIHGGVLCVEDDGLLDLRRRIYFSVLLPLRGCQGILGFHSHLRVLRRYLLGPGLLGGRLRHCGKDG